MTAVDHDERIRVGGNMILYGGSFYQALGEALIRADLANAQKIKEAWPDAWKHYSTSKLREMRRGGPCE